MLPHKEEKNMTVHRVLETSVVDLFEKKNYFNPLCQLRYESSFFYSFNLNVSTYKDIRFINKPLKNLKQKSKFYL